jgi:hypothetical protein
MLPPRHGARATRGRRRHKLSSDSADPVGSSGSGTSDLRVSPSRLMIGTTARSRARVPPRSTRSHSRHGSCGHIGI